MSGAGQGHRVTLLNQTTDTQAVGQSPDGHTVTEAPQGIGTRPKITSSAWSPRFAVCTIAAFAKLISLIDGPTTLRFTKGWTGFLPGASLSPSHPENPGRDGPTNASNLPTQTTTSLRISVNSLLCQGMSDEVTGNPGGGVLVLRRQRQ